MPYTSFLESQVQISGLSVLCVPSDLSVLSVWCVLVVMSVLSFLEEERKLSESFTAAFEYHC